MDELVELIKWVPKISLDIRYATKNNFTGKVIYPSARCFLRKKTAEKIKRVYERLEKAGWKLKIFDGYRPCYVQKIFWEVLPDPRYVADPAVGSRHSRAAAVDAGLEGVFMGGEYDEFSERSSYRYRGEGSENREILRKAMEAEGMIAYENEWWHFDDEEWEKYPLLDAIIPC